MLLELKKVKHSKELSEDSDAFTAEVYLDGVKRATAQNEGMGGPTNVQAYCKPRENNDPKMLAEIKANREVMTQYEAWAAEQPWTHVGVYDFKPEGFERSLQADVDNAFVDWLKGKYAKQDEARMKRLCRTKWVFTLKVHKGKPTKPGAFFYVEKSAHENLAGMGQHLRTAHGPNLIEFLNEKYQ